VAVSEPPVAPAAQRVEQAPAVADALAGSLKREPRQPAHSQSGQLPASKPAATADLIEPDSNLFLQPDFLAADEFEMGPEHGNKSTDDSAIVERLLQPADDMRNEFDSATADVDVPTLTDSVSKNQDPPAEIADDFSDLPELDSVVDSIAFDLGRIVHPDELGAEQSDPGSGAPRAVDADRTEMLEALANAKVLEDISNSMAETLFGDDELEKLAATLAVHTSEAEEAADTAEQEESSLDSLAATGFFRR
jgi:hypothetical protein